ncbi:DUF975 family protein [Treponema zioleckii]|uniref:DUF975 family protein n=1 Tax=Treponema zioleckii TaxID=331680 RepID=UPI00168B4DA2|nr:DUF975 family protein [Treponema zioleckii]
MFDSSEYKKSALKRLKECRFMLILAGLFPLLIAVIFWRAKSRVFFNMPNFYTVFTFWSLCALGIIKIASSAFFLKASRLTSESKIYVNDFICFAGDFWEDGVISMFLRLFWVCLWSFLFVVPGIMKVFAYSMTNFVLVENPSIGVKKAMRISKILTDGHKADLLGMYVSFWPWMILTILTCGLSLVFLYPYIKLTQANVYSYLKQESLRTGKLLPSDFYPSVK